MTQVLSISRQPTSVINGSNEQNPPDGVFSRAVLVLTVDQPVRVTI